jgi:hypothetical protein
LKSVMFLFQMLIFNHFPSETGSCLYRLDTSINWQQNIIRMDDFEEAFWKFVGRSKKLIWSISYRRLNWGISIRTQNVIKEAELSLFDFLIFAVLHFSRKSSRATARDNSFDRKQTLFNYICPQDLRTAISELLSYPQRNAHCFLSLPLRSISFNPKGWFSIFICPKLSDLFEKLNKEFFVTERFFSVFLN